MKQTVIEQAIKSIKDLKNQLTSSSQKLGLAQAMDILEGYKEMHKQEIEDAFTNGDNYNFANGKQYYNETYNK